MPSESVIPKIKEHDIFQASNLGHNIMLDASEILHENAELPINGIINTDTVDPIEIVNNIDNDDILVNVANYTLETFADEIRNAAFVNIPDIIARYHAMGF